MKHSRTPFSRRRFVRLAGAAAAALPVAGLIPVRPATAAEKLSPQDPTASALGYVEESAVDGQWCNNCNFWQGGDAQWGGCPLFPGKEVAARGWCKSWIKKA